MQFRIEIDSQNAAFSDGDGPHEVARILRELASHIEQIGARPGPDSDGGLVFEVNGNRCGTWNIDPETEEEECEHDWNQTIGEADESGDRIYCLNCGQDGDA